MRWWESGWEVGSDMVPEWNPGIPAMFVTTIILLGSGGFILYQLFRCCVWLAKILFGGA